MRAPASGTRHLKLKWRSKSALRQINDRCQEDTCALQQSLQQYRNNYILVGKCKMLRQFFISAVAIAGGVLEPSSQKNDFSRFSAFRDSTVYACCGSYSNGFANVFCPCQNYLFPRSIKLSYCAAQKSQLYRGPGNLVFQDSHTVEREISLANTFVIF